MILREPFVTLKNMIVHIRSIKVKQKLLAVTGFFHIDNVMLILVLMGFSFFPCSGPN